MLFAIDFQIVQQKIYTTPPPHTHMHQEGKKTWKMLTTGESGWRIPDAYFV